MWGIYSYIDVDDADSETHPFFIVVDGIVYSLSAFFETVILFLLSSSSIGVNAFRKSYLTAAGISIFLLSLFTLFGFMKEQESANKYFCISNLIAVRYTLTSVLYTIGFIYSRRTAPNRHAITRYVAFIVPVSMIKGIGRFIMANEHDFGYCVYDAGRLLCFTFFPSIVYLVLKRDSQYWTEDITQGRKCSSGSADEAVHQRGFLEETKKNELPDYKDVVIPKTELYYQSKLEESMGASLQLHIWRRKVVCVKVFQMDYLTRDSIMKFKDEANAMRRLRHDNIVRFMVSVE